MAVPSKTDGPDAAAEPNPLDLEFSFHFPFSPPAMCAADDIFLAGKILPFGAPPPTRTETAGLLRWQPEEAHAAAAAAAEVPDRRSRFWGGGAKTGYRRLRRVSNCDEGKALLAPLQPAAGSTRQHRPRWYLCVLGSMWLPATMDMSDIRNRQRRRSSAVESGGEVNSRGTWKLLRSLSCKGLESATAVTAPLSLATAHVKGT